MITSKKQMCWFIQPGKMREMCNLVEFKNGGERNVAAEGLSDARTGDNTLLIKKKKKAGKELGGF